MTSALRVLTVLGTRPEAIKLFPIVQSLQTDQRFVSRLCVTGQHREMLWGILDLADLRPDHDLDVMAANQSLDQLTARLLPALGKVLDEERPDWVIVQGDTLTAMCGALAAFYRKVPVLHVEAGLRSGNMQHPWPEEGNRKIISALASLHCAPTEAAAQTLLAENIDPATIHVTGNSGIDALHWALARIEECPELASLASTLKAGFEGRKIVAVTSHRRENLGRGMENIAMAIRQLSERDDVAVIMPLHRNPLVRSILQNRLSDLGNVVLIEPLDYLNFAHLLNLCDIVLTDSGGIQEEAPSLGKPVLVMRETTERPEGISAGTARLVGTEPDRILSEVNRLLDDPAAYTAIARAGSWTFWQTFGLVLISP